MEKIITKIRGSVKSGLTRGLVQHAGRHNGRTYGRLARKAACDASYQFEHDGIPFWFKKSTEAEAFLTELTQNRLIRTSDVREETNHMGRVYLTKVLGTPTLDLSIVASDLFPPVDFECDRVYHILGGGIRYMDPRAESQICWMIAAISRECIYRFLENGIAEGISIEWAHFHERVREFVDEGWKVGWTDLFNEPHLFHSYDESKFREYLASVGKAGKWL